MNATSELPVHGAAKPPAGPESQPKPQPKPNLILSAFIVVAATVIAIVVLKITPLSAPWQQNYDPTGHWLLSTLVAALPVVVLLGTLALGHVKAHYAALAGLATALLTAILGFHMPARLAATTAVFGAGYGLFPIGWIVLNVIFMYQLTVESGQFHILQHSLTGITQDRRLQLLLIAFCFGAFFEGAAGFGTPVAVTAALLIGLGFKPLQASGLSLIANTAPVAFGALGTPIIALAKVTGINELTLAAMSGRILAPFCIMVPFWLIWAFAGFKGMREVWPAILVAGVSFTIPQVLVSNMHGPWLVNVVASVVSMLCLIGFLLIWSPKKIWRFEGEKEENARGERIHERSAITRAWIPWVVLSLIVFLWGFNNEYTGQIYIQNMVYPVASATANGVEMTQSTNGYWSASSINSLQGATLKLTDVEGHVVTGTVPQSDDTTGASIGVQFPVAGDLRPLSTRVPDQERTRQVGSAPYPETSGRGRVPLPSLTPPRFEALTRSGRRPKLPRWRAERVDAANDPSLSQGGYVAGSHSCAFYPLWPAAIHILWRC